MGVIMDFLASNRKAVLLVLLFLLFAAGTALLKKLIRKSQRNKELARATEDKVRDENLNHVILNSYVKEENRKEVYKPYDVDYSNPGEERDKAAGGYEKKGERHIMLQLIERTELSTRKFLLNPEKRISIGSDPQGNDITIMAEGVSPRQCEIFSVQNNVYIRNLSQDNKTILKRKKEQAIVDAKGIRILSGDTVIVGRASYDITIINQER